MSWTVVRTVLASDYTVDPTVRHDPAPRMVARHDGDT